MNEIVKKSDFIYSQPVDYTQRKERLIDKIQSYSVTKELYDLAHTISTYYQVSGPWEIQFVKNLPAPSQFRPIHRAIELDPSLTEDENFSHLLFELINITHLPQFNRLVHLARRGEIGKEEYAKEVERIEFGTSLIHHRVASLAIQMMDWPKSIDIYMNQSPCFECHWEQFLKYHPHSEVYRNDWERITADSKKPSKEFLASLTIIDLDEDDSTEMPSAESPKTPDSFEEDSISAFSRFTIIDVDEDDDPPLETICQIAESVSTASTTLLPK